MPSFRRPLAETLETRTLYAAQFPFEYGGGGFDNAQKVVQARDGSLIVAGLFSGSTNFARKGQTAAVLTASGDTDIYVASYATDGALNWVRQFGGDYHSKQMSDFTKRDVQINQRRFSRYVGRIGEQPTRAGEYVNDITVDADGNVYLAGAFRETFTISRRASLTADDSVNSDYYDALIMKISSVGGVVWAKQIGGAFDDDAMSIGLDAKGNVTVGGYYTRQTDLNPGKAVNFFRTEGRDAGFVLRLDNAGNYAWAYQFDSDSIGIDERNAVNDIAVTRAGEVYLAGTFASDADFDPTRGKLTLESQGKTDAFLAKLSRKGALVWTQSTGGDNYDGNSAVALDAEGNVYTAGYFTDEADVNPLPDVETIFKSTPESGDKSAQFSDILISKVTADGTPVWQKQIGGGYIELVGDLAIGGDGGVYLGGSFFNTMDVDPGRGVYSLSSTLTNAGSIKDNNTRFGRNESYDWFAVKLSPRGYFVSANKFGGADDDYSSGLTVLGDGNVAFSGRIVNATGTDRDNRQEQSLIELLSGTTLVSTSVD